MPATTTEAHDFTVTLSFRHPAWDERAGITFEVVAHSKKEAIKIARRAAYNDGHTIGKSATDLTFRAVEVDGAEGR